MPPKNPNNNIERALGSLTEALEIESFIFVTISSLVNDIINIKIMYLSKKERKLDLDQSEIEYKNHFLTWV